ncbi:MAG: S-layer homology domain-containing protein, partial [Oscillospiraceae bacterium]
GHKLSLVIFPSSSSIGGEDTYNITIDNAATYASIPVYQAPVSNDTGTVTPPAPKLDPPSLDEKSGDATVKIPVKAAVRGDTARAKVPERAVSSAITSAMKAAEKSGGSAIVKIEVDAAADAKAVETTLTNKSLSKVADGKIGSLEIATPVANIALNRKALSAISENAKSGVKISAARVETDKLTAAQAAQIGGAPVFDFTVTSGEDTISDFNGGAATIAMPYTLKEGEDAAFITVWLLDDGGKLVPLKGQYASGMVTFVTEHFSRYAIGYLPFADVATDWSYEGIVYAYNQHLFGGVEKNQFAPNADMTRGMLWTVLYRMAGSPNKTENAVWYADAQAWVIAQNISDGNHQENKISREQLAVMLYRFAKGTAAQTDMSKFTDEAESSDFAADAMRWAVENGILNGSEGKLHPQGSATRAEVAAMLQRLANIKK